MSMQDETPRAVYVDGYDEDAREMGDCGVRVIHVYSQIMTMKTCELEAGHDGLHEWDPKYVDPEDEDDEGSEVWI